MKKLTFVTGNPAKAKYLSDYFSIPVDHVKLDLPEIQSLDLGKIVNDKARRAYEIIKNPVIVEDVSLRFEELGKLPGPLIKWFFEELGNEGLCMMARGSRALAQVKFAIYDGSKTVVFSGERNGFIAPIPRGDKNFGWDPIFIPNGYDKTWAEMSEGEKHVTSMRRLALEEMLSFLKEKGTV